MRGGAIPLLAWACILGVLFAGNWVWTGDPTQIGEFGFAVVVVLLCGVSLTLANRRAARRGAPPPPPAGWTEQIPELSYGALGAAIALGAVMFGLAFGHFLIYFGAGLFVLSIGRIAVELRSSRATDRRYRERTALGEARAAPVAEPGAGSEEGERA